MSATRIPIAPLLLGLSGLIPFIWGAVTTRLPELATIRLGADMSIAILHGRAVLIIYGVTILAFMSGIIWGFATRSPNPAAAWGYALSVLPALWGFFAFNLAERWACGALAAGLVVLLALDLRAIRLAEAPHWWLPLRLILTTVAAACLLVGALG